MEPYAGVAAQYLEFARHVDDPEVLAWGDPDLATLLPAFAALVSSGPVALLEARASAGLTLYPDLMPRLVADGACQWVSNEAANVFPDITATAPDGVPDAHHFVPGVDGRMVARTHGHGRYLHWLARPRRR